MAPDTSQLFFTVYNQKLNETTATQEFWVRGRRFYFYASFFSSILKRKYEWLPLERLPVAASATHAEAKTSLP